MSQRTYNVNKPFVVELKLKVTLDYFSNHEGFKGTQVDWGIQEFKKEIENELLYKVEGTFQQQEFLQAVDLVTYTVERVNQ